MPHERTAANRSRLAVTALEDRTTPAGAVTDPTGLSAVGSRAGTIGTATVYAADGTQTYQVTPYGADFTGGVRVALADVTGDGTPDLVTAPGRGIDVTVNVYDGASREKVASFPAYEPGFTGGGYVAAADLTGDGLAEVVTGADEGGGPRVRVFDGAAGDASPAVLADFLAIDDGNFRGGVRLALGDVGGDGVADLVVGAGFGGGPRVAAFDGAALAQGQQVPLFPDFFAFEPGLRNGCHPAVGDLNADGRGDLIFGAGPGGGPRVLALDGKELRAGRRAELANFFAGSAAGRDGVQVGTVATESGAVEILGVDLSTGAANLFGADGRGRGNRGGPRGGFGGGLPFAAAGYTVADADALAAQVVGTYTGTGAGTLTTVAAAGGTPTSASATATVTVEVTAATPLVRTGADATDETTPLRGLNLTGTATVAVAGQDPLTLPFTGTLLLGRGRPASSGSTDGTAAAVRGRVNIATDRTGDAGGVLGTGFGLSGFLADGGLTADRLLASAGAAAAGGTVFQSPGSRAAGRVVLARA